MENEQPQLTDTAKYLLGLSKEIQEIQYRRQALKLARDTDLKVAAKYGACKFMSKYLPMSIALGLGAGLGQFSINTANNINGKR